MVVEQQFSTSAKAQAQLASASLVQVACQILALVIHTVGPVGLCLPDGVGTEGLHFLDGLGDIRLGLAKGHTKV